MEQERPKVTSRDVWIYGFYGFFVSLGIVPQSQFLNIFLTEDIKITAATVGTILLVARVLDFIASFGIGGIMESANFKSGKYLPWLRITRFTLWFGLIIMFLPFPMPLLMRAAFLVVAYLLINMSTTFTNTSSYGVLALLAGPDLHDRNRLNIANGRLMTVSLVFSAATTVPVRNFIAGIVGSTRYTYILIAAVYGSFYALAAIILSSMAKRVDKPVESSRPRVKITVKDMARTAAGNTQLIIYLISGCLYFIGMNAPIMLVAYYYIYIVGNTSLTYMALGGTIQSLFRLFATMVGPKIGLKLGRKKARFTGQLIAGLSSIGVIFFAGHHVSFYIGLMCLTNFGAALYQGYSISYIIDCGEYGYWKTGIDNRTVTNSLVNIPMKIAQFIGGSLGLYGLAMIGWKTGMTVTPAFTSKFMLLLGGISAICYLGAALMTITLYKIDDKEAALYARENVERKAAQEAAAKA
jgi:GPH family glycoside/pentoside/hexuronide:cation symporter